MSRPLNAEDLRITDDRYGTTLSLRRCRACGFVFADGAVEDIPRMYRQLDDPEYLQSTDTRRLQMEWLLDRVLDQHVGFRSLLDVGAGTGLLVDAARRRGLTAVGIEPSRALAAHAIAAGISVIEGILPNAALEGRTFDVVTLVDVIEHVPDPVNLLRHSAARLSPDGVLVVVTPDVTSVPARVMGKRWWHYRLAHIGYFCRQSLAVAAERADLTITDTFSARWFFRLRYVAERMGRYLPLRSVNRAADRLALLRHLYERTIAFDLHDSIGVLLRSSLERRVRDDDKSHPFK